MFNESSQGINFLAVTYPASSQPICIYTSAPYPHTHSEFSPPPCIVVSTLYPNINFVISQLLSFLLLPLNLPFKVSSKNRLRIHSSTLCPHTNFISSGPLITHASTFHLHMFSTSAHLLCIILLIMQSHISIISSKLLSIA
jgi:hypothetical protein